MSERPAVSELPVEGPAAPPRSNGELVFDEPWQSRLFGLTLSLEAQGLFRWSDFQQALIAEIARWEATASESEPYRYYDRWQRAIEGLLEERGICSGGELADRSSALAARPHGHDHHH